VEWAVVEECVEVEWAEEECVEVEWAVTGQVIMGEAVIKEIQTCQEQQKPQLR
jgi:hypothetical protein